MGKRRARIAVGVSLGTRVGNRSSCQQPQNWGACIMFILFWPIHQLMEWTTWPKVWGFYLGFRAMDDITFMMHPLATGLFMACLAFAIAFFLADWLFGKSNSEDDKTDAD
jgi:hypothetical protein